MRICIINEFFYPDSTGGTGTVLSELARTLADANEEVTIDVITSTNLYRKSPVTLPSVENWDGINIYRMSSPHPTGLSMPSRLLANVVFTLNALFKILQLGKFDVVLVGTAPPMVAFASSIYKALTKTPFIYIVYDLEPDRSVTMHVFGRAHPFVWIFRLGQSAWLKAASRIVVLGRCMRDYVSRSYDLPQAKIDVIPIGANENQIVPGRRQSAFRRKHGIGGFVVLYSGNFGRYHDFDTILDAAKGLLEKNPDIKVVLVGGGAQEEHIAGRVANERIDNVKIFDFVSAEDYSDLLASADVSLVTLEPGMEGLCVPSKFYSILASGRPVVAMLSQQSEVSLVINESNCGIQVDQGASEKLIDSLVWLAEHPVERQLMGNAARAALVERFGTKIIATQYYEVFKAACIDRPLNATSVISGNGMVGLRSTAAQTEAENQSRPEPVTID
jgi:colanic acid biosynthesis glycosyl transferase WcaI